MSGKSEESNPVLIDKNINLESVAKNTLYPAMSYQINSITEFGMDTEKKRLELLDILVARRRRIRDIALRNIDELILYCDNKILDIADDDILLKNDPIRQKSASLWQKTILDLEQQKIGEQKELFRDILFLRNEWIKSLLNYVSEKKLSEIIRGIENEDNEK